MITTTKKDLSKLIELINKAISQIEDEIKP